MELHKQLTNNKINNRKVKFEELLFQVTDVSKDVLQDFCDYWTEPNRSGTKMRFEMEKTFDLNLRLKRWCRNNKQWEKDFKIHKKSKVQSNLETWKTLKERN